MFFKKKPKIDSIDNIDKIRYLINTADKIVIGAGAGLSTAAGLEFGGERFDRYFSDFKEKYNINDMYYGSFCNFESEEEFWGFWSRKIYYNRFCEIPTDLYTKLFDLVKEKDYFVITTNADGCFLRSGFDKDKLFYVQGDYGLFQCSVPCSQKTYKNENMIEKMMEEQVGMAIPSRLLPRCPECYAFMTPNLRVDDKFVEPWGWERAKARYERFIRTTLDKKTLLLELGVGQNTPAIIKYPFWSLTSQNQYATYVCITKGDAQAPKEIASKVLSVDDDIKKIIDLI
ncbi:Sir2 silent information regulator family NAD-dependent deacetylase [Candidatus Epulonipiscium fishelsonii]|uniref:Sir2 silent information regulator family NAD-dependent deacetylase n=1 Tax=Candidatus Epulonipiscium fishelsonii TaxID=77094 RepID=A0ACC8X8P2_9FIRM|nr:Sir2 silent information regulator family NAD-dependent deacetylase [Epulopiscium sp. SCG-B11WGA-EpuloA1]ONI38976.1 Sir2 silent information regulator family NAD-dependent deacetylase [Epulopiscium sp. SCG-B05WGA-EpuloA1]ONI47472.1 Sir2 silent information regulator family NAD-dependent deacetylase [Epulopiscium sp. SCG-C06WGA-EpuloA1]